MSTAHTRIFKSNTSQAVRLPKAVALPDTIKEVDIVAVGNQRIITPAGSGWDYWFDNCECSDDFMPSRHQEDDQQREDL